MIVWPNGSPPKDAPICGFEGEFCLQVKNHYLPKQTIKILKILKKIYYRLDFYRMTILKRPTPQPILKVGHFSTIGLWGHP